MFHFDDYEPTTIPTPPSPYIPPPSPKICVYIKSESILNSNKSQSHPSSFQSNTLPTIKHLKHLYKKLCLIYHPDKIQNKKIEEGGITFEEIANSYEMLCDVLTDEKDDPTILNKSETLKDFKCNTCKYCLHKQSKQSPTTNEGSSQETVKEKSEKIQEILTSLLSLYKDAKTKKRKHSKKSTRETNNRNHLPKSVNSSLSLLASKLIFNSSDLYGFGSPLLNNTKQQIVYNDFSYQGYAAISSYPEFTDTSSQSSSRGRREWKAERSAFLFD